MNILNLEKEKKRHSLHPLLITEFFHQEFHNTKDDDTQMIYYISQKNTFGTSKQHQLSFRTPTQSNLLSHWPQINKWSTDYLMMSIHATKFHKTQNWASPAADELLNKQIFWLFSMRPPISSCNLVFRPPLYLTLLKYM